MNRAIAVTGIGLITPAGIGVEENWERICEGRGLAAKDPELVGAAADISCRVPTFDAAEVVGAREVWRTDRFVQLALVAAKEAVADAGLDPGRWDGSRVGIVVGSAAGGVSTLETQHERFLSQGSKGVSALFHPMALVNMVSGRMAIEYGATGPNLVTATACASGATAIGVARDLLLSGACDVVLAGGTEAAVTPTFVTGFARMGALYSGTLPPEQASRPFDANRSGFVIGEGAGILVLERVTDAHARGPRLGPTAWLRCHLRRASCHLSSSHRPRNRGCDATRVPGRRGSAAGRTACERPRNFHSAQRCDRSKCHRPPRLTTSRCHIDKRSHGPYPRRRRCRRSRLHRAEPRSPDDPTDGKPRPTGFRGSA